MKHYILRYDWYEYHDEFIHGGKHFCEEQRFLTFFNAALHAKMYKKQLKANCQIFVDR